MIRTQSIPALTLALLVVAPGCAALGNLFNTNNGSDNQEQTRSEPSQEQVAEVDAKIDEQLAYLAERPVEPWASGRARDSLLELTRDINVLSQGFESEEAKQAFRRERLSRLQRGWSDYFTRAHQTAMAAGDPELAQALTATQLLLQEKFIWYIEREDLMIRFREEADAIATVREAVFAERGEYTKLNETLCIAALEPLADFGEQQTKLRWHMPKQSEVYVRCVFPTTLESQTTGGMSFDVFGEINVWGSTGEGDGDRLIERVVEVPVEVQEYRGQRYFDFAFDLGEVAKSVQWGYVRLNGIIEWTVADEYRGLQTRQSFASTRLSFE